MSQLGPPQPKIISQDTLEVGAIEEVSTQNSVVLRSQALAQDDTAVLQIDATRTATSYSEIKDIEKLRSIKQQLKEQLAQKRKIITERQELRTEIQFLEMANQ